MSTTGTGITTRTGEDTEQKSSDEKKSFHICTASACYFLAIIRVFLTVHSIRNL